ARLLDHRGPHDEAAAEIDKALTASPPRVAAYFAYLVGGRVAVARARYDEALGQYREAVSLIPTQSAMVGASQAALMAGDGPTAPDFLERLGPAPRRPDGGPGGDFHPRRGRHLKPPQTHPLARAHAPCARPAR